MVIDEKIAGMGEVRIAAATADGLANLACSHDSGMPEKQGDGDDDGIRLRHPGCDLHDQNRSEATHISRTERQARLSS